MYCTKALNHPLTLPPSIYCQEDKFDTRRDNAGLFEPIFFKRTCGAHIVRTNKSFWCNSQGDQVSIFVWREDTPTLCTDWSFPLQQASRPHLIICATCANISPVIGRGRGNQSATQNAPSKLGEHGSTGHDSLLSVFPQLPEKECCHTQFLIPLL